MPFEQIAVLGAGLLGGSLALAVPARMGGAARVRLWARRAETVAEAHGLGIGGATGDLRLALDGADLIILATPVGAFPGLAARMLECGVSPNALVTDVASVKRLPHEAVGAILAAAGLDFIGSHPMAGSEKNGVGAAAANLFDGAACILTDDGGVGPTRLGELSAFWQALGSRCETMSAQLHDELVARISHLPHVLAAVGAKVALAQPADGRLGGGGLRDTTRVAGGNAAMWAEILLENRAALERPLRDAAAGLSEMLAMLEACDHEGLRRWLEGAKQLRDGLPTSR
jgi:prephenate dehydrogenase